ncbi:16S rRNA (guanine(966)-N(2))-methyltransferase RsmD [Acidovorax sp. 210-6]|uniref:16S rRNA (guanine(966)-N(2))-methyltransferase RsmD n=1 Tax=Acidovorax sp. 210-6 TaxID=2699468 RepID=UPI00138A65AC|nr:16S rRNA (guanine(966)-N(2))-methyltransferase RsmD [Acidovorax sp. 210-6]NCU67220.1 16S rRNA (guanine(966)-N(2))-methyltransferase RsmD [Acidovorax sp. 210-6]
MSSRLSMAKVQAALRKGVASAAAPVRSAASPAAPVRARGAQGAGEIRIIGGQWKRTRLPVPQRPGLRPTPDRVRETLFNWLGQDLTGWRCLDAFAGTGALGLEAASRGAASVVLVEQDGELLARLQQHVQRLQARSVQVRRGDGVAALRQCAAASLDLVLLDPPFDSALFQPALQAAAQAVGPQGWVYLEAPQAWDEAALASLGLALHRHLRAGAVHAHLLRRA